MLLFVSSMAHQTNVLLFNLSLCLLLSLIEPVVDTDKRLLLIYMFYCQKSLYENDLLLANHWAFFVVSRWHIVSQSIWIHVYAEHETCLFNIFMNTRVLHAKFMKFQNNRWDKASAHSWWCNSENEVFGADCRNIYASLAQYSRSEHKFLLNYHINDKHANTHRYKGWPLYTTRTPNSLHVCGIASFSLSLSLSLYRWLSAKAEKASLGFEFNK